MWTIKVRFRAVDIPLRHHYAQAEFAGNTKYLRSTLMTLWLT
jgi:hypothetical protein